METELTRLWKQLAAHTGVQQKKMFIDFCSRLVGYKEKGDISEEDAAYRMVGAIQFENLSDSPECQLIFDIAGITELPRDIVLDWQVKELPGKSASEIKQIQWARLVDAIEMAKQQIRG